MSEKQSNLAEESRRCLENAVGSTEWNNLVPNVQTGILTSEICIRSLDLGSVSVDYSAAIIPIMRVLECALFDSFYKPYLSFLQTYYTPQKYISRNKLDQLWMKPNDARRKILWFNKSTGSYSFRNYESSPGSNEEFTIGNFSYTVGVRYISSGNGVKNTCDPTAIEFYKQCYFNLNVSDSYVQNWICSLARKLESMVHLRNSCAHAGSAQTKMDAQTAMDTLVKIDHVILDVICPK